MLARRLALAVLLSACGPQPADTANTSSTADTLETTATPTTGEPVTPAVCDASEPGVDPLPDPATCEDFRGTMAQSELEIRIINRRDETVFVPGSSKAIAGRVRLSGELGGRPVHAPYVCDDEPPPCDALIDGGQPGCTLVGKVISPLRLEPGARRSVRWSGLSIAFPVLLPGACAPAFDVDTTCTSTRPPSPGAYTLSLTYSLTCEGPCTCDPDPDGACTFEGSVDTHFSDPITAEAAYDGQCAVVDIIIN